MSWNYRVMRFVVCGDHHYRMHVVHYDESGKPKAHTVDGVILMEDSPEQLRHSHELMGAAFTKPILEWSEVNGYCEAT